MNRLRLMLTDNLHLKGAALVLSLVLFVFVRGDRVSEMGILVPVIYDLPEDRVLVNEPVKQLRLTLAGRQSRLRNLLRRGLDPVPVDLREFRGSAYEFDESVLRLEPGLRLISIQPAKTELRIEAKARKAVPVAPNIVGTPDPAFRLAQVAVSPSKIPVDGAESILRKLNEVRTLPLDVDGRWESTDLSVGLSLVERGLSYDPNTKVTVRLTFEPRYESRVFGAVPVELINSAWQGTLRPESVRVTIEAPVRLLPGINAASFKAVVDGRELEGKPAGSRHRLDVELENLPETVRVVEIHPSRVLVRLDRRMPSEPEPGEPGAADAPDAGAGASEPVDVPRAPAPAAPRRPGKPHAVPPARE